MAYAVAVLDETPTPGDLLDAWQETTRAAELAERLAKRAVAVSYQADTDATTAEKLAEMAEAAAQSALTVAATAREAAIVARSRARDRRDDLDDAAGALRSARTDVTEAHDRYSEGRREDHGRSGSAKLLE